LGEALRDKHIVISHLPKQDIVKAGKALHHAVRVICSCLDSGVPFVKIGITGNPFNLWTYYNQEGDQDGRWSHLVLLAVYHDAVKLLVALTLRSVVKHLMKLVDALSIKVVVALGRYAEKRARATLEGHNVRVAYLLHPSPRNDMPSSDWVDVAQASLQNVFPQIRVQGRHGPSGRIEQEQQAAPSTPVRRRHSMELPLQQQQLTPERLVRRSRSPRRSVRVEISDLRLGRGPSSLSTVLVVSGKVVRSHAFGRGGGSLRLRDTLTMHDIDMKFVGAASDQYRRDVVGCWVCVRSFKVLRIKDEVCKSYAPPGASHELVVTDSCADVNYLR
jgi:hypothetical protein